MPPSNKRRPGPPTAPSAGLTGGSASVGWAAQVPPLRTWLLAFALGTCAYAISSRGLVLWGGPVQLPLLVGCLVGLVSVTPLQGAAVALTCAVGGLLLSPPELLSGATPGAYAYLLALVLAPAAGALPPLLRSRLPKPSRVTLATSAVLVVWILANLWAPLFFGGFPPKSYGLLDANAIRAPLADGTYSDDQSMYRRVFTLMHEGQPYYSAMITSWRGESTRTDLPPTPAGIRLPTYFWIWRLLPSDPFSIVYLFLACASVGVVSAAFISGQIVGPRLAPFAALAVAAFALEVGFNTYVVFVDLPATAIALAGIAILLFATRADNRPALWGSIAVFTAVALTREFLAYLLVLGALSAFLEPQGERIRRAWPWWVGLGVFAAGYTGHVIALQPYLEKTSESVSFFNGGFAFVWSALSLFSGSLNGGAGLMVLLVALGFAGALVSGQRSSRAFSAFAAACIVVPLAAMLVIGNESYDATRTVILNYWGMLVIPVALAFWPCAARLVMRARA